MLALFSAGYVNPAFWEKAGRRSFGYAYVFCLASKENAGAKLVYFINPSFLIFVVLKKRAMLRFVFLLGSLLFFNFGFAQQPAPRRIVITIDDLPVIAKNRTLAHQQYVTEGILDALTQKEVPAIGFVNENKLETGGKVDPQKVALLKKWLEAGLDLGNHTYAHPDYHRAGPAAFEEDILRGERITKRLLMEFGKELQYFRHPFLHTGNSEEKKVRLEKFLEQHHYTVAPVTMDNSEWIFARAYDIALERQDTALMKKIGASYLTYMEDKAIHYERKSRDLFDREIPQILLIHSNTINADYLAELLAMFEERSYQFISLAQALKDSAYRSKSKYTGRGGISWLDRWALTQEKPKTFFAGEPKTPQFIQEVSGITE